MGRFDLVPRALEELGVQLVFHKVAQRPGKPLWFGVAPSGAAVFALPGNPVSTLVCLARYVIPALFASMGQASRPPEKIALGAPGQVNAGLDVLHARARGNRRLGSGLGVPISHQRIGRLHSPWPAPTASSSCPPDRTPTRRDLSPACTGGKNRARMPAPDVVIPLIQPAPAARHARPPAARPAHFGDGPLQLPLPLLHAAGDVSREVPVPAAPPSGSRSRRSCGSRACSCRWACASSGSPAASRCCARTCRTSSATSRAIAGHRGCGADHQRRAARAARRRS